MQQPSQEEIISAQKVLAKLEPGFLPPEIFYEVVRLAVTTTIEMVPLRRSRTGEVEVLLTRREADDPYWPNQPHVPGTVLRASDREGSYADAFMRILEGELAGISTVGEPVFIQNSFHQVKRGRELALIHYVEVAGEPKNGAFYPVNNLPKNIVSHQVWFIKKAAEVFAGSLS